MEFQVRLNNQLLALIIIFIINLAAFGDQLKPRIAVMPFNPIGVSKNDAKVVTGLFETGLVKTGSFIVIEQQQINEILSVQGRGQLIFRIQRILLHAKK